MNRMDMVRKLLVILTIVAAILVAEICFLVLYAEPSDVLGNSAPEWHEAIKSTEAETAAITVENTASTEESPATLDIQVNTAAATDVNVLSEEVQETETTETVSSSESMIYNSVPLYLQTDYPDTMYGYGTIATSGCSITALAMVATYMTEHVYSPDELADWFGGKAENNMSRLEYSSDALQLPYQKTINVHDALNALKEGKVVIALMNSNSIFTNSDHFIVLVGMTDDGKIIVNDPYGPNYDYWLLKNGFINGFSEGDIICGYSGAWIYDKSAMPETPFIYVEEETPYGEPRYPDIQLTNEELELLARVVWVEAQGESFEGQQAVAEVILNRLASDNFPNTLNDVFYAEGQFCSVPYLDDATPCQAQYEAIEAAIYGPYILPTDVFMFANYKASENIWGQIGGHYFFYSQ